MKEKCVVRLSTEEREELRFITKKLSGSSQKVRRANILLKRLGFIVDVRQLGRARKKELKRPAQVRS